MGLGEGGRVGVGVGGSEGSVEGFIVGAKVGSPVGGGSGTVKVREVLVVKTQSEEPKSVVPSI